MKNYTLAIHGGAGTILKSEMNSSKEELYKNGLEEALNNGFEILENKGSAIDAVVLAVEILENNPLFNAGKGAVFSANGNQEMDASIMDGKTLKAGAICDFWEFQRTERSGHNFEHNVTASETTFGPVLFTLLIWRKKLNFQKQSVLVTIAIEKSDGGDPTR